MEEAESRTTSKRLENQLEERELEVQTLIEDNEVLAEELETEKEKKETMQLNVAVLKGHRR
jgi:hypothetical protein